MLVLFDHAMRTLDFWHCVHRLDALHIDIQFVKKKMIILHKGTAKHRTDRTSSPQGEPDGPPSVLTPQSPCTTERAVGVGTLYRDTIYAATAMDKCNHALLHVAGWGVITPVELEARPGSGALLLSIEPMLERQSACKRQIKGNH